MIGAASVAPMVFPDVDFEDFHQIALPKLIDAGNGALAAPDLQGIGPIAFKVPDGASYSYVPGPDLSLIHI